MLKTFFKVFAIILAVIYVFSFILSISVMYASNALISSRYHIRVDLNNSNNNNKIETSFYAKDEIVEEDEYTYSILSEKSSPYQITIDEYDMSEDLIVKINVLKTCDQDINSLALDIAGECNANIVQVIGRVIILFKESKKHLYL